MKLVLCPDCRDVVSLARRERRCLCKRVGGKYVDDRQAVVDGDPVVIGMDSRGIVDAAMTARLRGTSAADGTRLEAFVIPTTAATVTRRP